MKNLTFSKVSMSLTALALLAVFGLVGCGPGGGGGTTGGGSSTTTTVQGNLAVASGDNATQYTVFNSNLSSTPSSAGSFSTSVLKESPTYTYAISDTGNKVYAAVGTNAEGSMTINAQSTAEAMVLLNPLLIPRTSDERTKIINIVKADTAVRTLATVIESVYASVDDPMSDSRILNALTDAVKSVLTSWQASNTAPAKALPQTPRKSFALAYATGASGSSSLQIINNDMGALTLANSAGSTLKLELNNVGPMGITTNVDWVVRIVELDPAKIQWTQYGGVQLINPTLIDIDSLIKTGGYDQVTIIEGAVASGLLLNLFVDPIGKVADSINAAVFPDADINLPHDGVYAVIALSGSQYGDTAEYNSVKNSGWQRLLYAEAAGINMISAAIDVVGVGTTFAAAAGAEIPDISPVLVTELAIIKTELTNNPDYAGTTATAYFVGKAADIGDKLLDNLRPYIHSSISNLQSSGLKKFFHVAVNTAKSVVDVWSGTVTVGTRVGNYLFNVTPRESGYAVLGTFPGQQADTTPPSVPTGVSATAASVSQINLTWSASTDDVGVTGYKIYRGGIYLKSASTTTSSDTGLSASTQYCYTVSAYDAAGNESNKSTQACAKTSATADTTPPTVTLTASPSSIANGATSTLSWSSTNSTSCTSSGGGGIGTAGSFITPSLTTTTTYTVTCTGSGGTASQSATVTVAIPNTFSISGSAGLQGVTMTLSGANSGGTSTDANGNYTFGNLANGSYTVAPALSGYSFTPASLVITVSGANITAANFTATIQPGTLYSITGTVTASGYALSGVTMTLSGANSGAYTTGANGMYGFALLANGSYTVTPALSGYTFTPASSPITISGANIMGANFTATTVVPSTPIERITNGSFTSGTIGWTLSGDFWAGTNLNRYYTSPGYASGGVDSAGAVKNYASGYMYQTVTIPSNATSATLSFQLNITSDETGSAYDYLYVEILNSSGALLTTPFTFSNVDKGPYCGATCTYNQQISNLISFKGQTIRVRFRATTDNALSTVFRIDDVSLMADGN